MPKNFALPSDAACYRQIGPFNQDSLPAGLLAEHRLKEGVWGVLTVLDGAIGFSWDDADGGKVEIAAPASIVIPPTVPHHIDIRGPFILRIGFHRQP
jgi:tellurite resistance-related uncharacterized protein